MCSNAVTVCQVKSTFFFLKMIKQVSQYVTEGLERAMEPLNAATALRERFGTTSTNNRKVAAVVAAAVCSENPPLLYRNFESEC